MAEPGETCDDGNTAAGDGCDASCIVEPGFACVGTPSVCTAGCGDGVVGGSEECDDGNLVDGDGCDATCRVEPSWTCVGAPSSCTPVCGNSRVVGDEECDDGNTRNGDCCDARCHFEPAGSPCLDDGDICSTDVCGPAGVCEHEVQPDPKLYPSLCGDGRVTGDEQCDDGNTADGDCCDSNCQLDPAGSPCADDGNLCSNDTCNGTGVCQHRIGPDPACFVPTPPAAANLIIRSG